MRVSLKWLRDYVDITLSARELGERLTAVGLELNDIEHVGDAWDNIVVGEVTSLSPHPDADRLTLATVDLGAERFTVVCGAPNIGVGQRVPFARIGARLIDGRTGKAGALKRAKIRGVVSEGMVCSEKELGISDDHDSILVLSPDTPIGVPLSDYLGDVVLDLDITPNRPDCLSVTGVAREIAALTDTPLSVPAADYAESGDSMDSLVSVDISAPDLCPRYCAGLITGIRVGPSPGWMQQRLASSGVRPINNVVDVTNYVMLEHGQPLHAFDYDRLAGHRIMVRRAKEGESIVTIDGVERRLDPDMLVIADQERAIAVAGIMGSGASEVTSETTSILLESANFDRVAIRHGCDRLRLRSEASLRFDKGLNSELPPLPLKRAMQLLLEVAGGRAARGVIDVYPGESLPEPVSISAGEVERLSGLKIGLGRIRTILTSLGFVCREGGSGPQVSVVVPYWRSDIRCTADLVEEIVRIAGYDNIPDARLSAELPRQQSPTSPILRRRTLRKQLRTALTGLGYQEVLTYPLVSLERLQSLSPNPELKTLPLKVANPMSKEQEYLRTTLRSGVLAALGHNQRVETSGIKLFEIGKVFRPRNPDCPADECDGTNRDKGLPSEDEMVCAVLSGLRTKPSWHQSGEMSDFFDAKGILETALARCGIEAMFSVSNDETMFPGRGADVLVGDERIGVVGELHPGVAQAFDLSGVVFIIELDVEKLLLLDIGVRQYRPFARFPGVTRDIALVLDEEVSYQTVESIVRASPMVTRVTLFDLYRGEQLPPGKKSFAIRIIFQARNRTLTDHEADRIQEQMLGRLEQEVGAVLRG